MKRSADQARNVDLIPAGQSHYRVMDGDFEEIGRVWETSQGWQSTADSQTCGSRKEAAARVAAEAEADE